MALLDDLAKGVTPAGLAMSVGTMLLAPVLLPAVSSVLRPVAKGVLSTGIQLYRQAAEPVSRAMSGLVLEAQLELAGARAGAAAPAPAPAPAPASMPTPERPVQKATRRTHKAEQPADAQVG